MCGICGQYNFGDSRPVSTELLRAMTSAMFHRGPDDEGYHVEGSVGLGFRRLSIIDLEGGHQPMSDEARSVWVVFNGEIYNFRELRNELEGAGYRFRTQSDTEVIVHGYRKWGIDILERLDGMFGLALWDERRKRLMLARDRTGIKLVYYTVESGRVRFASEVRALLAADGKAPSLDPVGLSLFLRYRYTPSPYTAFRNILKLAPGTRLIVEDGSCKVERWWNYAPVPADPVPEVDTVVHELSEIYLRALKRHLISDVPLGLLLSGGVDSGLLLAMMKRYGGNWKTFTVGYGKTYDGDELADAARTAELMGQPNYPVLIARDAFEATLPKMVMHLEEPIASSSVVPMYHVCERASRDVKVALIGQGPDELFGGYNRHIGVRYGHYWRSLPNWIRLPVKTVLRHLPRSETIKRSLYSLDVPERLQRYQQVFSIVPEDRIGALFQDGFLPPDAGEAIVKCWGDLVPLMDATDELGGLQFIEVRSSLPDELLMYADKLSMAHSLELRVPYLDRELVEYVEQLPEGYKVNRFVRKWIHKKVCEEFLPKEIIRRRKRGFAVNVVDKWFRDSIGGRLNDLFLDPESLMYRFLVKQQVQQLYAEHKNGRCDNHKVLFSLVVFEEWLRAFGVRS